MLTLPGDKMVRRMGASIQTATGVTEMVSCARADQLRMRGRIDRSFVVLVAVDTLCCSRMHDCPLRSPDCAQPRGVRRSGSSTGQVPIPAVARAK
jgi:predicted O-linked N-acetylglucosamine transferase (SPINDLY family)